MSVIVAVANMVLGWVYVAVGILVIADMVRGWRSFGFSRFGSALVFMAFTCGPHHIDHGLHLLGGREAGPLDIVAVLAGYPAGFAFVYLRVEAFIGGRGDRFVRGSALWVRAVPFASAVYLTLLGSHLTDQLRRPLHVDASVVLNAVLIVVYLAISFVLLRTQLNKRAILGGWSASGLSLGTLFWTCAAMHAVTAVYTASGRYDSDIHGVIIDAASVPAALYFLWITWCLYRDSIGDWNREPGRTRHPVLAHVARRTAA